MPDREEEGAGTSVEGPGPSMPPSYLRIPAGFPTEHGKMARVEFLMLSATPKYCPLHLWLSVLFVREPILGPGMLLVQLTEGRSGVQCTQ